MPAPRVRFAPSPTGYLHVGGARTALFNWLFARRAGGVFVLRIEDTDVERSSVDMVEGFSTACAGSGSTGMRGRRSADRMRRTFNPKTARSIVRWPAGSSRTATRTLLLHARRTESEARRGPSQGRRLEVRPRVLRFDGGRDRGARARSRSARGPVQVPDGTVRFDDLVHQTIQFDSANIEDFVILRSDGHPTYQLSVVADDVDMGITHVVRGDDHISNTPKQILLYRALERRGAAVRTRALDSRLDKKRLSKRHGATSVMEYARQGVLPEAMFNFLALLGWSPGGNAELFSRDELMKAFSLEGISGGSAVFNPEKLEWFNQQHIMRLAPDELARRIKSSFEAAGLWRDDYLGDRHAWFFAVLELLKPRAKRLDDFAAHGRFFFVDAVEFEPAAVDKHLRAPGMAAHLTALATAFGELLTFDPVSTEQVLRRTAEARAVKAGSLIHAGTGSCHRENGKPWALRCARIGRSRCRTRSAEHRGSAR
jgi:glutamyl-tRNA synthetase